MATVVVVVVRLSETTTATLARDTHATHRQHRQHPQHQQPQHQPPHHRRRHERRPRLRRVRRCCRPLLRLLLRGRRRRRRRCGDDGGLRDVGVYVAPVRRPARPSVTAARCRTDNVGRCDRLLDWVAARCWPVSPSSYVVRAGVGPAASSSARRGRLLKRMHHRHRHHASHRWLAIPASSAASFFLVPLRENDPSRRPTPTWDQVPPVAVAVVI